MKKIKLIALMLALLLVLCGCTAQDKKAAAPTAAPATAAPTAEPTAAPTAEPTAEPTAAPTAEPTAEPVVEEVVLEISEEPVQTAEAEADPVVGSAFGGEITVRASEVKEAFDANVKSYVAMYAQYGYPVDEYDVQLQETVAAETVQMELVQRIVKRHAEENGYALTAEQDEALKAEAQTQLDGMREYLESYLTYYGYTGDALTDLVNEYMAGYDLDMVYETLKFENIYNYVRELAVKDVAVTDEEVVAAYDAKITMLKETYANPDAFIDAYMNGEEILYTPEGMRTIECIVVGKTEETAAAETAVATPSEATPSEATPSEAADPASLTGLEKANAVLALLRSGADFEEMKMLYSDDAEVQAQEPILYPVAAGTKVYGDVFTNAAMALEKVGDVSEVIDVDYAYFILRYAADMEAGAVALDTRKDAETQEALTAKQEEVFSAYTEKVVTESGVALGDTSSLYNIFVSEPAVAEIAYLTTTGETQLTDMPAGAAVAKLAAGASLDVLGRIGVDGLDYVFVSVPGTGYKGYVNAADTANMEPDDALKVDNTLLVTAGEAVDKLPTFTIAMNDGSVIYGELYPDVTPESVGNFISLANSGFYNGLGFHRIIPGFMIQGGDPNGDGTGGPGYAIRGEFKNNGVENALSHTRGVLSMARSAAMDSAGSQFFIMHADNDYLDGDYAAFGLVLGGIETVDLIASVPTGSNDKPKTEQVMREVYVETYGKTYEFTKLDD